MSGLTERDLKEILARNDQVQLLDNVQATAVTPAAREVTVEWPPRRPARQPGFTHARVERWTVNHDFGT